MVEMPIDVRSLNDLVDGTSNDRRSLCVVTMIISLDNTSTSTHEKREGLMLWKRTNDRNDARSHEGEHRPLVKITCIGSNSHWEGCLKIRMKVRMQCYQRSLLHSVWLNHDKIPVCLSPLRWIWKRDGTEKNQRKLKSFTRIPPSPFSFPSHYISLQIPLSDNEDMSQPIIFYLFVSSANREDTCSHQKGLPFTTMIYTPWTANVEHQ